MRTTITLAPDVAAAVEDVRRSTDAGISEVVNDLIRRALAVSPGRPTFRQESSDMGRPRLHLDDIAGLLDTLEGDDRRA